MSVSNLNQSCGYHIGKLEDAIYIIDKDALKNITIDNGSAYIYSLSIVPRAIKAYNISLEDTEELNERYKFTHTIRLSVKGYSNKDLFDGDYYFAVKSTTGTYWMVNPLMPCKVTYTYTLDGSDEHTDFTLSTVSNFPTLRLIYDGNLPIPTDCGYKHSVFKSLKLNEAQYVSLSGSSVINTNDGFKNVDFLKNTASFTESFDGNTLQHGLTFRISFDAYSLQSSWHYNLLEFQNNKYAAIVETTNGKTILAGFNLGLLPSYTVTANNSIDIDNIEIRLNDKCDNCTSIPYLDSVSLTYDTAKTWEYTTKYNGYECVGNNTAKYLLQEELDAFLNPTGRYKCLTGYTAYFTSQGLNIIGNFSDYQTFSCAECTDNCDIQTSFPPRLEFNGTGTQTIDIIGDSDWSISSSDNNITVNPSSGEARSSYSVSISNNSSSTRNASLTLRYCTDKIKTYPITVTNTSNPCFSNGTTYTIDASAQYLTIPKYCCVEGVSETSNTLNNIEIQESWIKVWVPANPYTSSRAFTLNVSMCLGNTVNITINQTGVFETWNDIGTECNGVYMCTRQRRYTGTTSSSITAATDDTRYVNCSQHSICQTQYRWKSTYTVCVDNNQYMQYVRQYSYDGNYWYNVSPSEYKLNLIAENSQDCSYCGIHTTLTSPIYFTSANSTQYFDLLCDSDWTASVLGSNIILGAYSGTANSAISLSITNNNVPSSSSTYTATLFIHTCDRDYQYEIDVEYPDECYTGPSTYYAPSSGGTFIYPLQANCSITSVSPPQDLSVTAYGTGLRIDNMPERTVVGTRTYYIGVTFNSSRTVYLRLIQRGVQSRYAHYSWACIGDRNCSIDRQYTAHTVTNITGATSNYRYTNCLLSDDCG